MSVLVEQKGSYCTVKVIEKVFIRKQSKLFLKEIENLRENGASNFVLDFSTCDYVSSEGLGVLAEMWHWCNEEDNGIMTLALSEDPNNELKYLLDITGLGLIMKGNMRSSLETAEELMLKLIKDKEDSMVQEEKINVGESRES